MNDIDKAMDDLAVIRHHLVEARQFQGLGAVTVALTSVLALLTACAQLIWPILANTSSSYFSTWIVVAFIAVFLMSGEMVLRTKRHHHGFADEMLLSAAANFIPAAMVGAFLFFAFFLFAPDLLWLLPALWLVLIGLGILASSRMLPPLLNIGAAVYILLGFSTLLLILQTRLLTPWTMAIPFSIGQAVLACLVHKASKSAS